MFFLRRDARRQVPLAGRITKRDEAAHFLARPTAYNFTVEEARSLRSQKLLIRVNLCHFFLQRCFWIFEKQPKGRSCHKFVIFRDSNEKIGERLKLKLDLLDKKSPASLSLTPRLSRHVSGHRPHTRLIIPMKSRWRSRRHWQRYLGPKVWIQLQAGTHRHSGSAPFLQHGLFRCEQFDSFFSSLFFISWWLWWLFFFWRTYCSSQLWKSWIDHWLNRQDHSITAEEAKFFSLISGPLTFLSLSCMGWSVG